jgi:isopentenyldiphosphate isomerase
VEDWKYVSLKELQRDAQNNPHLYTEWFKLILKRQEIAIL